MAHLEVDLVAADRLVWQGQASQVSAPAAEGEMGILVGHEPVLAVLRGGSVRIRPLEGPPVLVRVAGGFLSVDSDRVTIVADEVEVTSGSASTSH